MINVIVIDILREMLSWTALYIVVCVFIISR